MNGAAANPLRCTKSVPTVIARNPAATHNSPSPRLFKRNGGAEYAQPMNNPARPTYISCGAERAISHKPASITPAISAKPKLRVCASVITPFWMKRLPPVNGKDALGVLRIGAVERIVVIVEHIHPGMRQQTRTAR